MAHNPECGLDCVSAGAVRLDNTPSADQQTGRRDLAGDQSVEQVIDALKQISARSLVDVRDDESELRRQLYHIHSLARAALVKAEGRDR
jgi:hypothetical protein